MWEWQLASVIRCPGAARLADTSFEDKKEKINVKIFESDKWGASKKIGEERMTKQDVLSEAQRGGVKRLHRCTQVPLVWSAVWSASHKYYKTLPLKNQR